MRIQQLLLETNDIAGLSAFYQGLLGLPVTGDDKNIVIQTGSSQLTFRETSHGRPFYHFAFTIPANAIIKAKEWLHDKVELIWISDYKSEIADFVNWHARSVYFFDPAGNIVELIARLDLDNATEDTFSFKQFLSISEAGLVFEENELDKKTSELLQRYQLSYFYKQSPLPQFKAVGNDDGLFIIVPANRNWYPTKKTSGMFPMEILFENEGNEYSLKL